MVALFIKTQAPVYSRRRTKAKQKHHLFDITSTLLIEMNIDEPKLENHS